MRTQQVILQNQRIHHHKIEGSSEIEDVRKIPNTKGRAWTDLALKAEFEAKKFTVALERFYIEPRRTRLTLTQDTLPQQGLCSPCPFQAPGIRAAAHF